LFLTACFGSLSPQNPKSPPLGIWLTLVESIGQIGWGGKLARGYLPLFIGLHSSSKSTSVPFRSDGERCKLSIRFAGRCFNGNFIDNVRAEFSILFACMSFWPKANYERSTRQHSDYEYQEIVQIPGKTDPHPLKIPGRTTL